MRKKCRKVKFGTDRTMVSASLCSKLWIMDIFGTIGSNPRRAALDPLLQGWGCIIHDNTLPQMVSKKGTEKGSQMGSQKGYLLGVCIIMYYPLIY